MISGRGFADKCSWVQDPRYPEKREFYYQLAKDGDWVFINGDYIDSFIKKLPTVRTKRFTIIVHNSDRSFGKSELDKLLSVADHIYAINTIVHHPKLTTIPIGFIDKRLQEIASFTKPEYERTIELYCNFKVVHNAPKRQDCMDAFKNDPRVVVRTETEFLPYLDDLCRSKFVLCPEGTGIDTHRVYEALLCGATPVVLRNSLSHLYERLPVCIVNSWNDPFYVPTQPSRFDINYFLRSI
jgi:hypothetical protein